eukprot:CAMPEP_0113676098 /NCGR_PEP_ID=MMETSP0038_2-20120614/8442_1 /TAXON_ID=2898 /ORGANISM="Cryptomonas paramecium" /LENGTH=208 /DNA_ID=CAMNT_0000593065 /DNA_START=676 /DNA_END=1304 /DNA_ORIENTATION=+ /assembly_acc=CAM_ASM_000170
MPLHPTTPAFRTPPALASLRGLRAVGSRAGGEPPPIHRSVPSSKAPGQQQPAAAATRCLSGAPPPVAIRRLPVAAGYATPASAPPAVQAAPPVPCPSPVLPGAGYMGRAAGGQGRRPPEALLHLGGPREDVSPEANGIVHEEITIPHSGPIGPTSTECRKLTLTVYLPQHWTETAAAIRAHAFVHRRYHNNMLSGVQAELPLAFLHAP